MSRRKVLWFINKVPLAVADRTGTGGVRGGWLDLYIDIVGAEHDIALTVAFPDESGAVSGLVIDGVTYVGLPAFEPRSRVAGVIARWRHDAAPSHVLEAVARVVRDAAPVLIHLHGAENCYGLAVRGSGVPTVLSIQGSPTAIARLWRRGIDRHYLRSLSLGDFLKGRGPFHYHARMKRQAANEAAIMASVGHIAGRTDWDRRLASAMAPQAVYHHCEEPMRAAFHGAEWDPVAAEPGRILSTSGHYALKGVGTLLRALGLARRTAPGLSLVLAGVPPYEEHRRAVMRHVRALGLEACVTVRGEVDAATLAGELERANLFVIASHSENSSNALCEAQLVGVPCIASSAGGLVTLADDGSAALLLQDGDAVALAGAMLSLLEDPDEAARLAARGRVLARTRHDREHIRTQIRGMYDDMLSREAPLPDPTCVRRRP